MPKISLLSVKESPFIHLFGSGDNQALLNCCGVDHPVFRELLSIFKPVFDTYTVDRYTEQIRPRALTKEGKPKGKARVITPTIGLALVLTWYRTRGSAARTLSMIFGLTSTPLYKWLKFSRKVLLFVLHKHPNSIITSPTDEEVDAYVSAIERKYQTLGTKRVWGAADGLKVKLEHSTNWAIQSMYYNQWGLDTYINSCLVFAPDGRIRMATFNCPGTFHDSTMADYGMYERLEAIYERNCGSVVVDSAFRVRGAKYLVKSQQNDPDNFPTMAENYRAIILNQEATAVRQLSEWGMRMIQGQFPRMKDRLRLEELGDRKIIVHLVLLLYNYQCSKVGINQILNTFMSDTSGFESFEKLRESYGRRQIGYFAYQLQPNGDTNSSFPGLFSS